MINALLIDMDGVLLDSSEIHARAYKEALGLFGINIHFSYAKVAGRATNEVMSEIVDSQKFDKHLAQELTFTKQRLSKQYFSELTNVPVFPGVKESLIELAKHYSLVLCTSASKKTVEFFFSSGVDRQLFQSVISSEDVTSSKPNPEIYLHAIAKLGLGLGEVLVIEDSYAGVRSGLSSGARVVWLCDQIDELMVDLKNHKNLWHFRSFRDFAEDILCNHDRYL